MSEVQPELIEVGVDSCSRSGRWAGAGSFGLRRPRAGLTSH
jgi:hypothetical protein